MKKTYFLKIWGILFTLLPLLNGCIREEEFNNTPQGKQCGSNEGNHSSA